MEDHEYHQSAQASVPATNNGGHPLEDINRGDQHPHNPDPTISAGNFGAEPSDDSTLSDISSVSLPERRRLLTPSESGASSDGAYEPEGEDFQSEEEDFEENLEPLDAESGQSPRVDSREVSSNQKFRRGPNAPQLSKLARRIQDRAQRGIELDTVGTRKGTTRYVARLPFGRQLEYDHNGTWVKAVYHYRIRGKLLRITDAQGQYKETPDSGGSMYDRTAFKSEQKDLEFLDRKHRPEVLFQWESSNQAPSYKPELMYDNGRIVLSYPENRPVKAWRELPLTLSGQCEGLRMEFYRRLNEAISMRDLKARMPKVTSKGGNLVYKIIKNPMLANRCSRDRMKVAAKAWNPREGSLVKERGILAMIPFEIQKKIVLENSTRCWRDLSEAEVAYVDQRNRGTEFALKRAGPRLLTPEERQKRVQKEQSRAKKNMGQNLTVHPVLEEALSKPARVLRLKRIHSRHSSALDTPSTARAPPRLKRVRNEQHGEQRLDHLLPEPRDQSAGKYTRYFEDEGTRKKRKHAPARPSDRPNEQFRQIHGPVPMNTGTLGLDRHILGRRGPDYRLKKPVSEAEQQSVDEALQITRDNYQFHYGLPPLTASSTAESYAFQLSELQADTDASWPLRTPPPALDSFTSPWYGSFDAWRSHYLATQKFHHNNPEHRAGGGFSWHDSSENLEGETLLEE
ncbi:MAG: hypothetical protein Q9223_004384 [Gallowayella weberi]